MEYHTGWTDIVELKDLANADDSWVMWEEPPPRVKLDLPSPLLLIRQEQEIFYIDFNSGKIKQDFYNKGHFNEHHSRLQDAGLLFGSKEDALEWKRH